MNKTLTRALSTFVALALLALLSACGGGGSSSSGSTTTPVTPSPTLSLTGSATAISAATPSTLTATLKNGSGGALSGVVVTFKTTGTGFGLFVPNSATALTDANGVATITLNPGTASGADSVTATASVNGATVTSNVFGYTATGTTTSSTVALLNLSASLTSVASDNSNSSTITATVVDAANAALAGIPVTFSASSGVLSSATATTDATGRATVTFSAGANATTRTATIVATASTKTSQIPVNIAGSTLTVTTTSSTLIVGGPVGTLTVVAKNSGGTTLSGQGVTVTQSGSGGVTLTPASGSTDASGTFVASVTAVTPSVAGNPLVLTVTAAGETRTVTLSITGSAAAFQLTAPSADATQNGSTIGTPVTVSVIAPSPTSSVTFVTTLGTFPNGTNVVVVPVTGGTASTLLSATSSGTANIQAFDSDPSRQSTRSDSRTVFFTAACATASRITLQSSPSVVSPSAGGTTSLSTLLATVTDSASNPVGGCPIAFNIVNPTGGGESVSPVVVLTASVVGSTVGLGQASTTFTAGSLPSAATGVQVRATVIKAPPLTNISTGAGTDATVVIGGTAGSVTIGVSTVISDSANSTIYTLPMSVLVADSNGNPVANSVVSLSAWPIAFNVGGNICDGKDATTGLPVTPGKFFFNEDMNENLIRDPGEITAFRLFYPSRLSSGIAPPSSNTTLSPPNSAAGNLPATVTTNASGVATFTLTYTKSSAGYIYDRIRARTLVQGTETLGELQFLLPVAILDLGPPCLLGPSSFR